MGYWHRIRLCLKGKITDLYLVWLVIRLIKWVSPIA